jgi:flagellin
MGGNDAAADRQAVVSAINAKSGQTGVVAVDSGSTSGGIQLVAADGRNISITANSSSGAFTSASTGLSLATNLTYGTYSLSSNKAITVSGSYTNLQNAGVNAGTYSTQTAYGTVKSGAGTAFATGDISINGVIVGASLAASDTASNGGNAGSAIAKVAAINAVSAQTGVTATVNANTVAGSAQTATAGQGTFVINGVTTASITMSGTDASADRAAVVAAINAKSGQTGVVAVDSGSTTNGIQLVAADGRNISITANSSSGAFTSASTGVNIASATTYGTFTLTSAKSFTVASGTTGQSMSTIGMLGVGTYGQGKSGQALSTIDVSTAQGANAAIVAIDNAITSVNSNRANLGAIQNRFMSTISTLQSTSENLTSAKSRITDADFAAETANLTRAQILQQAGTAMLAQANSIPQGVLALLRG